MAPNLDTQARDPAATEATETRDAAVQIWPVALAYTGRSSRKITALCLAARRFRCSVTP